MDISLSPEVQLRIERTLSEGRYGSANELMLDALDALECAHEDSPEQARQFDAEITRGFPMRSSEANTLTTRKKSFRVSSNVLDPKV